jgi:hypothetical protein
MCASIVLTIATPAVGRVLASAPVLSLAHTDALGERQARPPAVRLLTEFRYPTLSELGETGGKLQSTDHQE